MCWQIRTLSCNIDAMGNVLQWPVNRHPTPPVCRGLAVSSAAAVTSDRDSVVDQTRESWSPPPSRRPSLSVKRRLCVIAFADVANWTSLVEQDDVRAWRDWRVLLTKVIEPALYDCHGRLVEVVGDAAMTEFDNAHDAVNWAISTQRDCHDIVECLPANRSPMHLRIGVHLAEVIVDGERRIGHGVNVAARIHQWAAPGEIIASRSIVELLSGPLACQWDDLGPRALKNISQPVPLMRFDPRSARLADPNSNLN